MDQLAIINRALLKCGLPLAAALNDCDWNATLVYDACASECLRSFAWNFAQKVETLAQTGTPAFGFAKSYALPDDCLRVIDVHCAHDLRSPKGRYVVQGRRLLANVSPCYLRYISSAVPCEDWPPDFCDAVAARIALEIAPLSTQSVGLVPQLAQFWQLSLATAQAADARESAERVPLDENILLARSGYERVGKRGY